MLFSAWTWLPVVIILFLVFYANQLPEMRKQAEEKFKEGKALFEKKKKEIETKASEMAEKAKEKQKEKEKALNEKKNQELKFEDDENISVDDLSFMPTPTENKEETAEKSE